MQGMYFRDVEELSASASDDEGRTAGVGTVLFRTRMAIEDADLPIKNEKKRIMTSIRRNRVTVIVGSTGSGKSTIIPAYILDQSKSSLVKLAISQPRRIAAIRLADRVASFMVVPEDRIVGQVVGYGIRGKQQYDSTQTKICYVTTGYFQRILAYYPQNVTQYTHVLLDEVHERSVDSDFLCLILRILLARPNNAQVRLVVMSATMQASMYREYFTPINGHIIPQQITLGAAGTQFKITNYYLEDIASMIPDGCYRTVEQALEGFVVDSNTSTTGVRAEFSDSVRDVCIQLILKFATEGNAVLCFLPGHGEMSHVTELLEAELMRRGETVLSATDDLEAYNQMVATFPKYFYEINSLHGLMPQSQMNQPLNTPPAKCRRIILATNVAESSLTVKGVNVVIDSGLRKISKHDYQDSISRLVNIWCSRASITQRRGRTGRICDGISIRLFTREWEQRVLGEYDLPDAAFENFTNVLLFAKQLCELWNRAGILPSPRPSVLMNQLMEPPESRHLTAAVESLHQNGLTRGPLSELAPLTIMGILATRLQIDIGPCRLIYYAWIMGIPIEGIVLACACCMDRDVLRYPSKFTQGMEAKFARDSRNCLIWRERFDAGSLSEPITYRNILLSWICAKTGTFLDHGTHPLPAFDAAAVFSSEFDAFRSLCESIAERFEVFLSEDLGQQPSEAIATFRFILNHFSARSGDATKDEYMSTYMTRFSITQVPDMMPASFIQLKLLLTIAMNRRVIHADANLTRNESQSTLAFKVCTIKEERDIPRHVLRRKELALRRLTTNIIGEDSMDMSISPRGDELRITPRASTMQLNPLLLPDSSRVAIQFFERKRIQFRLQDGPGAMLGYGSRQRASEEDFIYMYRPRLTNVASWFHLMLVPDEDGQIKRSVTPIRLNYRNPVGWLMRSSSPTDPKDYWAVASCVVGVSSPTDMFGQSALTDTRADFCTILPLEFGGSLAMIMQLIGMPFPDGLEAVVRMNKVDSSYRVLKLRIMGRWLFVHDRFPITNEVLSRASAIRDLLLAGTNIGFDESGSIEDAMRQLEYVRKLLPAAVNILLEYCYTFFASDDCSQAENGVYSEETVLLIDRSKSPHIVTDSRMWIAQDESSSEIMLFGSGVTGPEPIDKDAQVSYENLANPISSIVPRGDAPSEDKTSPCQKRLDVSSVSTLASPRKLLPADSVRSRMKCLGFSNYEIADLCQIRCIPAQDSIHKVSDDDVGLTDDPLDSVWKYAMTRLT